MFCADCHNDQSYLLDAHRLTGRRQEEEATPGEQRNEQQEHELAHDLNFMEFMTSLIKYWRAIFQCVTNHFYDDIS